MCVYLFYFENMNLEIGETISFRIFCVLGTMIKHVQWPFMLTQLFQNSSNIDCVVSRSKSCLYNQYIRYYSQKVTYD